MHNLVLSPIDPEKLITNIADRVTANVLSAIRGEQVPSRQPDEPITIQEAAQLLKLSVPTLYGKVSRNEIPFMKRGNRLYFSRIELLGYLKEGRRKSVEEIAEEAFAHRR